jgi:hypothetical protein
LNVKQKVERKVTWNNGSCRKRLKLKTRRQKERERERERLRLASSKEENKLLGVKGQGVRK